jgi:hypothetical protein
MEYGAPSTATDSAPVRPVAEGAEDWAIVVGVSRYPELGDLKGPLNDAKAFFRWLTQQAGVPRQHIKLILSPFGQSPGSVFDARPTNHMIGQAFDELQHKSFENQKKYKSRRVGRRLYIYIAGHGFSPANFNEVALLSANATHEQAHNVATRSYADHFAASGTFEQVVLFVDCCRDDIEWAKLERPKYARVKKSRALEPGKALIGFAARLAHRAREKEMSDQRVRGIFSYTLLKALNGAACDEHGEITARSLADYTYQNMKKLLSPEELTIPSINLEPQFIYDNNPDSRFVIIKPGACCTRTFPVTLHLRPEHVGKHLRIEADDLLPVTQERIQAPAEGSPRPLAWHGRLEVGTYTCQILEEGQPQALVVNGLEDAHVSL